MRYTFNLKKPKSESETLIYFSSYFKNEGKKFVYSTGESIKPSEWDFENRQPNKLNGRNKIAENHRTIKKQLDRYAYYFVELINQLKNSNQEIDIESVKLKFDEFFKKVKPKANNFFDIYDVFLDSKKTDYTDSANSKTTIKRYEYNKKLLEEFQKESNTNLHFNKIDTDFYNSYILYCVSIKRHSANTLRRNIGLLKTFLNWALENKYTYKSDFKKFKSPKAQVTDEVALDKHDIKAVFDFDLSEKPKLERVRDLFVFGCSTGMRISNYSKVSKKDIEGGYIKVMDKKNNDKQLKIPLNEFSISVLEKYNYKLPSLSSQKFNEYIKDVFKEIGFTEDVKKTTRIGNEVIEIVQPLYQRISSHTARRSFITIMKNEKVPDKIIMEFTGHKSLEVFNKYYKPNEDQKKEFMTNVWKM